jgi:hypothetical protein
MSKPAIGDEPGVNRTLSVLRAQGEEWTECRNGIVCKTPRNKQGKRGTTMWYGEHRVDWEMIRMRPVMPKEKS